MKKTMVTILIVCLLLGVLTGCGRSNDDETQPSPDVTTTPDTVRPEDDNGMVEDDNGIIGDNNGSTQTDVPNEGILPEIGEGIEEGTNDVIDGMENGIEDITGNNGNANSNANGSASHRNRAR